MAVFKSDFAVALGTFVWGFFVFIDVCNTECFLQLTSYSVAEILQHHSDNMFHDWGSL